MTLSTGQCREGCGGAVGVRDGSGMGVRGWWGVVGEGWGYFDGVCVCVCVCVVCCDRMVLRLPGGCLWGLRDGVFGCSGRVLGEL